MHTYTGTIERRSGNAGSLGFPTINLRIEGGEPGIYAARTRIGQMQHPSAAYIGPDGTVLESHLLDFAGDLDGQTATVELLKKIRGDATFSDLSTLKAAIEGDIVAIRTYFARTTNPAP